MNTAVHTTVAADITQLEILGFDRIGFVDEITGFISDYGRIVSVKFEADGIRSLGQVKVRLENRERLESLMVRLKAISGLVKVQHLK
ncbi:MAG: ACT domain-containing protein [Spirosomataceae bacterium]